MLFAIIDLVNLKQVNFIKIKINQIDKKINYEIKIKLYIQEVHFVYKMIK
jgi:hypothetical protein